MSFNYKDVFGVDEDGLRKREIELKKKTRDMDFISSMMKIRRMVMYTSRVFESKNIWRGTHCYIDRKVDKSIDGVVIKENFRDKFIFAYLVPSDYLCEHDSEIYDLDYIYPVMDILVIRMIDDKPQIGFVSWRDMEKIERDEDFPAMKESKMDRHVIVDGVKRELTVNGYFKDSEITY